MKCARRTQLVLDRVLPDIELDLAKVQRHGLFGHDVEFADVDPPQTIVDSVDFASDSWRDQLVAEAIDSCHAAFEPMTGFHRHRDRQTVSPLSKQRFGVARKQSAADQNQPKQPNSFSHHLTRFLFCPLLHYIVSSTHRRTAIENETDNLRREDHIWVSRKLIYTQAALLGISAVTFFVLGTMVGNLTTSTGDTRRHQQAAPGGYAEDCRITGVVGYRQDDREMPDIGAVVILIPKQAQPEKPQAPGLVMPATFVALDNPAIEAIDNQGGTVVRADADGKFNVLVDQGRQFRLLVISKSIRSRGRQLSEAESLTVESWFAPSGKLLRDNDFLWRDVDSSSEEMDLGLLLFE